MSDPKAFLTTPRDDGEAQPPSERLTHRGEFQRARPDDVSMAQGARCMGCGIPFCHQGCPLGNVIPDFNEAMAEGRWRQAWQVLDSTNNLPEVTGRVCPAPCEAACTLAINDDAVTIEHNERDIAERAFAEGWVVPRPARRATGRSVAIVGSGPAGLAAAQQLARAGHEVTLLEKADRVGGLLRYGIPDFKLEKSIIDRRMEQLVAEGVQVRTGVHVGSAEHPWADLLDRHDAVVLAVGAERPRLLNVPGHELPGVFPAMDYLTTANRAVAGDDVEPLSAEGRDVVVLGGGDTGSDCVGTALRQGARSVRQVELMPAPPTSRRDDNPWPRWPLVMRTSSSHEEGGDRCWGYLTTHLEGRERVEALVAVPVDARLQPMGPEERWPCELLLLAMGFLSPVTEGLVEDLDLQLTDRGCVATDDRYRTSVPGLYAAGDARRGASLVVWAISEGREVARVVDADLVGDERLPSRGIEAPFEG